MDQKLLELINLKWTSPPLDLFMAAVSSFNLWLPVIAIVVLAVLFFGGFHGRAAVIVCLLLVGLSDGIVSNSLKHLVGRPRPYQVVANVRVVDLAHVHPRVKALFRKAKVNMSRPQPGPVEGLSFPSSHTMNNFCAAT